MTSAQVFNPKEFTLDNGLRCIVVENNRNPAIFYSWWLRVGGADEVTGKSGIAHFLEHLMFKGTDKIQPGEFEKIISRLGGENNAATSADYTNYYIKAAKQHLERIVEIEADRLVGMKITPEVFNPEKAVILEERHTRIDNSPQGLFSEQMIATLFLHHPYGTPVIGWPNEIRGLSIDDVRKFYKLYYAPNNVTIIIGGDITVAEAKPLIEKYYGSLKSTDLPKRIRTVEPKPTAHKRVEMTHTQVKQPQFMRWYKTIGYTDSKPEDLVALEIFSEILGGGQASYLHKKLVIDDTVAVGVSSFFETSHKDQGIFGFSASPAPATSLRKLEKRIDQEVKNFFAKGISDEEFERIKSYLIAQATYSRDSLSNGPNLIGRVLAGGGTIDHLEAWPERIQAATKENVMRLGKNVLNLKTAVTGYLLPEVKGDA
jgi:zinc protease